MSEWASIAVTGAGTTVAAAGVYLGQSIRRKTRADIEGAVAGRRLDAYYLLWEKTKVAAPMRKEEAAQFGAERRSALYDQLTDWYFDKGNGMVLGEDTRAIYLEAKQNLLDSGSADQELARAERSIRQLSLLRTSMRADLLVYSRPWGQRLDQEDRAFLDKCGVRTRRRPWRRTLRERLRPGGRAA